MKRIITFISSLLVLGVFNSGNLANAQSFTVQHDTINYSWTGGTPTASTTYYNLVDGINNTSTVVTDSVKIKWAVVQSDFPTDWLSTLVTGICDNNQCYGASMLWPSGVQKTSNSYANGLGDFHMQINLAAATSYGSHYLIVRMYNVSVPTDTAREVFIINRATTAVPMVKSDDEIVLYPNPARDELNIVYNPSSDVNNIAVYNIIGKVMAVYKVTDNSSANLNLENIPSGIYFVRLVNSRGAVVATRKFTKQ